MEERRSEEEEGGTQQMRKPQLDVEKDRERWSSFQMPLHYPHYSQAEYEAMPEWQIDRLLHEYGLPAAGDLHHKRNFAMGAFLWSRCRPN